MSLISPKNLSECNCLRCVLCNYYCENLIPNIKKELSMLFAGRSKCKYRVVWLAEFKEAEEENYGD